MIIDSEEEGDLVELLLSENARNIWNARILLRAMNQLKPEDIDALESLVEKKE